MVMLSETRTESGKMILNMGPQHPSTHGVLRLLLELEGETVLSCVPDIGFLHTGIEKTMEARNYHQAIVLTDRTDYLSPLTNNLSYVLACEKLFGIEAEVPARAQVVRVIMCELSRIGSHLIWLGTHALDLGATTVFLYCWREREQILSINELVSGVRMMTSYFRIGGLAADVPGGVRGAGGGVRPGHAGAGRRVRAAAEPEPHLHGPHPGDRDGLPRGRHQVRLQRALPAGLRDPLRHPRRLPLLRLRAVRVRRPLQQRGGRLRPVHGAGAGDAGERAHHPPGAGDAARDCEGAPIRIDNPRIAFPKRDKIHTSMESLIHHFKLVSEGPVPPAGEAYAAGRVAPGGAGDVRLQRRLEQAPPGALPGARVLQPAGPARS